MSTIQSPAEGRGNRSEVIAQNIFPSSLDGNPSCIENVIALRICPSAPSVFRLLILHSPSNKCLGTASKAAGSLQCHDTETSLPKKSRSRSCEFLRIHFSPSCWPHQPTRKHR